MEIIKHLEMLGKKVEDKVTGFKGVVASVSREEFEKWWSETKGTDIKETGLSSFTEEVMLSAWLASAENKQARIADLETQVEFLMSVKHEDDNHIEAQAERIA